MYSHSYLTLIYVSCLVDFGLPQCGYTEWVHSVGTQSIFPPHHQMLDLMEYR